MRQILLPFLLLCGAGAFAQTTSLPVNGSGVNGERKTMTGADAQKMFNAMKKLPGVVDEQGKPLDSMTAVKMTKTFEYQLGYRSLKGNGVYQLVLSKINAEQQARRDAESEKFTAPKNPALQKGSILDLRPLGDRLPSVKMDGKAVVLLIWYPGFVRGRPNGIADFNEVTSAYKEQGKFEMVALTKFPFDQAEEAQRTVPINNARQLSNATDIVNVYSPNSSVLLIVTDKSHKITYASTVFMDSTPRIVNSLLKAL